MKDAFSLLVISDLHAHSGDPSGGDAPSNYSTNNLYGAPTINPMVDIATLVKDAGLSVDWIVCPGDLGDKVDPNAQNAAWAQLEKIRIAVGADLLLGTAGNHDIDSRRTLPEFDPKSALQLLHPKFPTNVFCFEAGDGVHSDRFWSRNFVVMPFPDFDETNLLCGHLPRVT
jgi:hypothetical protein